MRALDPQAPRPEGSGAQRAARLTRFRGALRKHDLQTSARWRQAPAREHAAAMIDLSRYAERMAALTGYGKRADEMFPGFGAFSARSRPA